jgi:hypothetical protein
LGSVAFEAESQLRAIGASAFQSTALHSIEIASNVTEIGESAFANCGNLQLVTFAASARIPRLGSRLFVNSFLRSIWIPKSVRVIGAFCFEGGIAPITITFESDSELEKIERNAFSKAQIEYLVLPASLAAIDGSPFLDGQIRTIAVEADSEFLKMKDDFLVSRDGTKLIRYFGEEPVVTVGANVWAIAACCFMNVETLEAVRFDENARIDEIGSEAFAHTFLTRFAVPKTVVRIGKSCFENCESLLEVAFDGEGQLKRIEDRAFFGTALDRVCIPASVQEIGNECFPSKCAVVRR